MLKYHEHPPDAPDKALASSGVCDFRSSRVLIQRSGEMYGQKDLWGGLTDNYRKRNLFRIFHN